VASKGYVDFPQCSHEVWQILMAEYEEDLAINGAKALDRIIDSLRTFKSFILVQVKYVKSARIVFLVF